MNADIAAILSEWPYDPEAGLQVRRVEGADGRPLLQMRVDLGIIQMELRGRPDGVRPEGRASLWDLYRERAEAYRAEHGWYEGFSLDSDACSGLQQEALQHYHRRIACLALQDFEQAIADADHNLAILDMLKAFAASRQDWWRSEQYRAFILSQRIQAAALQALKAEDLQGALVTLRQGLAQIREVFLEQDREDEAEDSVETEVLRDLQRKLTGQFGLSRRKRLEMLLDAALRREDVDEVLDLRAQLREMDPADE